MLAQKPKAMPSSPTFSGASYLLKTVPSWQQAYKCQRRAYCRQDRTSVTSQSSLEQYLSLKTLYEVLLYVFSCSPGQVDSCR